DFGGVADAAVRHVGDMQQAVDAAQVDKSAIVREVFHHAGHDGALLQVFKRCGLPFGAFLLYGQFARNHDVSAPAIQLDDFDGDVQTDEGIEVANRTRINLRTGHKPGDPDIHGEPAFHAAHHPARNNQLLLGSLFEIFPDAQASGL